MPTKRLKIMRIIARLNVGGPSIHTILLTKEMTPLGYDTTLVTGCEEAREGNMLHLADKEGVEPFFINEMQREIRFPADRRAYHRLRSIMRQIQPDVVHTHTAKAGTLGRIAAARERVPVLVHTYHGHVLRGDYFSRPKTWLFKEIERVLARITDRLITVSGRGRDDLVGMNIGRPEQYAVIPLGLQLQKFADAQHHRSSLREELGLREDTPLVGIVARLVPIKDHQLFLQSAQHVLDDMPEAKFLIVGDGELDQPLRQEVETMGLNEQVIFLGMRKDLDRIYADLDCSVLCSLDEGLPVAVIEAKSAGCPVVATDVGGVREILGPEASHWVIDSRAPDHLAMKIKDVLNNRESVRERLLPYRQQTVSRFSSLRLADDLDRLYRHLLQEKGYLLPS